MELGINLKKSFILLNFLFLSNVPISEPRLGVLDITSMAPHAFAESPAMAPITQSMAPIIQSMAPSPSIDSNRMNEIKKICSETDYSSLCQSSIIPLSSTNGGDKSSMLQLAIKAAVAETNSAISNADNLSISPETDDDTVSSLDDCVSSYQSVLTDFREAEAALGKNDKAKVNTMLSAAISNIKSCSDGFDDPNPVSGKNDKLTRMTSNCLAISESTK